MSPTLKGYTPLHLAIYFMRTPCEDTGLARTFTRPTARKTQRNPPVSATPPSPETTSHLHTGSGFRVQGPGFRVQGLGFRAQGSGLSTCIRLSRRDTRLAGRPCTPAPRGSPTAPRPLPTVPVSNVSGLQCLSAMSAVCSASTSSRR